MKQVKIILTVDNYGTIPLDAFVELIDTSKVRYYQLKVKGNEIEVKFYDSKRRRVRK